MEGEYYEGDSLEWYGDRIGEKERRFGLKHVAKGRRRGGRIQCSDLRVMNKLRGNLQWRARNWVERWRCLITHVLLNVVRKNMKRNIKLKSVFVMDFAFSKEFNKGLFQLFRCL